MQTLKTYSTPFGTMDGLQVLQLARVRDGYGVLRDEVGSLLNTPVTELKDAIDQLLDRIQRLDDASRNNVLAEDQPLRDAIADARRGIYVQDQKTESPAGAGACS